LQDLRAQFQAVFIGFGAQAPKALDIQGADLAGVHQALPFLVEKNVPGSGLPCIPVAGQRVAVLGGGDTAMDCLRTAIRCGAVEARCLYRRNLENMPGSRREYANALEEGAEFRFLVNPTALEGDASGHVRSVRCVQMMLGEPDAQGRQRPRPVPGSESLAPADLVLIAFGFEPVSYRGDSELGRVEVNEWGGIIVDANQMTSLPGIFAGGDSVRGPSLVVHAVRDGRRAATGIDRYLRLVSGARR
jgi:glutamate synthase (NADPH/NADH) small chain